MIIVNAEITQSNIFLKKISLYIHGDNRITNLLKLTKYATGKLKISYENDLFSTDL